jgi:hypothetical protein
VTLGAFGQDGHAVVLDAAPVYGGDFELARLSVGFRARQVEAAGDVERYVRHRCTKPTPERSANEPAAAPKRMLMPFGKHRGEYVEDLPRGYVRWCLENAEIRSDDLRRALEAAASGGDGDGDGDGEEMPT